MSEVANVQSELIVDFKIIFFWNILKSKAPETNVDIKQKFFCILYIQGVLCKTLSCPIQGVRFSKLTTHEGHHTHLKRPKKG